ncbi:MAG TPA: RES family NAD+ phosphorylase [Steroidobacteraceae bacterium]|nr:RES family NAD+ phosphorylase [Steroidobacteraceae bacterium]
MSSNIWTPPAVGSEGAHTTRRLWRAVEAQHIASTLRLVGTVDEQSVLEGILDKSKPAVPKNAADLHYLLATPFRYASPIGSRFRAPAHPGVWYGAEKERTACAELGFWRWRFLRDSAGLKSLGPSPQTVFRAGINGHMVDLTEAPFKRARPSWTDPHDYNACQGFAQVAREARIDAIRYESVRDPEHGAAVAVLNPACFKPRQPLEQRIWLLTVRPEGAIWQREDKSLEFLAQDWR